MPNDEIRTHPDLPELSNEDVAILYEIINVASQTTHVDSLPFRAIFAAYDEVLSKHGISSAHDQLYLRFLFRLGERLGREEDEKDLFTEFESLLLELNIKIEIGSTQVSFIADEAYNSNAENEAPITQSFTDADTSNNTPRRTRRASYSDALDAAEEASRAQREWPESPASISRLQDTSVGFGSRPFTRRRQRRNSDNACYEDSGADDSRIQTPARAHSNVSTAGTGSPASRRVKDYVAPATGSPRKRTNRPIPDFEIREDSSVASSLRNGCPYESRPFQQQDSLSVLRTRQQIDAEVFDSMRIQNLARDILHQWQHLIATREDRRHQMLQLAIAYDHRELVKQALDIWKETYVMKKQAAELQRQQDEERRQAEEQERAQQQREVKAVRARDFYLVSKAFSHWANHTADRVKESALARKQLIKRRHFDAWKAVVISNEAKIRQFVLKKFVMIWGQKLQQSSVQRQQALILHENTLLRNTYWDWFWQFCDRRAPKWRNEGLKHRYFRQWVAYIRMRAGQEQNMIKTRQQKVYRQCYDGWKAKVQQKKVTTQQADESRARHLLLKTLKSWQTAAKLAPIERKVVGIVNWRLVSTAFSSIQFRCSVENQADQADRRRVVRNTWTTWNDELRIRTMQHQIDDRLVMQALYKWVLAERAALMKRLHEERLRQILMLQMFQKQHSLTKHLTEAEQKIKTKRMDKLKRLVLTFWIDKRARHREREKQAKTFYVPKVQSIILEALHGQHVHIAELERESVEAAYYLRGKRTLKKWNEATQESKKQKRRDAYTLVRRRYNLNLARAAFEKWTMQTRRIQDLQNKEHELQMIQKQKSMLGIMQIWSQRALTYDEMYSQALSYDATDLATATFSSWAVRSQTAVENMATASTFYDTRIQKTAYDGLRRFQLKILELQSHNSKATSVLIWNTRRRARGLFLAWSERAAARRQSTVQSLPDPGPLLAHGASLLSLARTPRLARSRHLPVITPQISPEHILPELPLQTPFTGFNTPMPAHLSTPSHRAARVKALASSSTTPFPQRSAMRSIAATETRQPSQDVVQATQSREESHTPPTIPHLQRTLRFAEEDTILESPLRLPDPPTSLDQRRRLVQTDIKPRGQIDASRLRSSLATTSGVRRSLFPNARKNAEQGSQQV